MGMRKTINILQLNAILGPAKSKRLLRVEKLLPQLDPATKNEISSQLGLSKQKQSKYSPKLIFSTTSLALVMIMAFVLWPKPDQSWMLANDDNNTANIAPKTSIDTPNDQTGNYASVLDLPEEQPKPADQTSLINNPNSSSQTNNSQTNSTQNTPPANNSEATQNEEDTPDETTANTQPNNTTNKTTTNKNISNSSEKTKNTTKPKNNDKKSSKAYDVFKKYLKSTRQQITNWRDIEF